METCIVLLRGINVGGNNLIKMAELKEIATGLGFENPRTLLQSGNLVVEADARRDVGADLAKALRDRKEMKIRVFVRSKSELDEVIAFNPFSKEAEVDPSHLLVTFLPSQPPDELVKRVQDGIVGPERIAEMGSHMYVVYPEGIGDSKVTRTPGWNELMGQGTARNWNTVLKLKELARG